MCRRWRQLVNSAPLLQAVHVQFSKEGDLPRLRSFCEWALTRALQHLQQLHLALTLDANEGAEEGASLMAAAVTACGAAGSLTELQLHISTAHETFTCSSWMAALRSLRRLTIECDGAVNVAASLQPLAALEELRLIGRVNLPVAARLPASLTLLHLHWFDGASLPTHVRPQNPLFMRSAAPCCFASDVYCPVVSSALRAACC